MKSNLMCFYAGIVLFISGCNCTKEKNEPANSSNGNLILSENFESNNQPIPQNSWYDYSGNLIDSASLIQDAPSRGGNWSLILQGEGNAPQSYVETFITGISGKYIYDFNVYMKIEDASFGGASLKLISQNQLLYTKSFSADSISWKLYSLTDTISSNFNDTIIVSLFAGGAGPLGGNILFDLVEFKKK